MSSRESRNTSPVEHGANDAALHAQAERELWRAWTLQRTQAHRLRLYEHYSPWMRLVAGRLAKARPPLTDWGDYLSLAAEGLLIAIDRFEPRGDSGFKTYAELYIRGSIRRGVARFYREPGERHDRERIAHRLQPSGTRDDLLESLMNAAVDLAFGYFLESGIVDDSLPAQQNPYAIHQQQQHVDYLHLYVARLPERERQLVQMHYFDQVSFVQIAEAMGVSKPRVSQLHAQAIARIRAWFAEVEGGK